MKFLLKFLKDLFTDYRIRGLADFLAVTGIAFILVILSVDAPTGGLFFFVALVSNFISIYFNHHKNRAVIYLHVDCVDEPYQRVNALERDSGNRDGDIENLKEDVQALQDGVGE